MMSGSSWAVGASGSSEMQFPHRARTCVVPSVMIVSPCRSSTLFFVQKTWSPFRYDT